MGILRKIKEYRKRRAFKKWNKKAEKLGLHVKYSFQLEQMIASWIEKKEFYRTADVESEEEGKYYSDEFNKLNDFIDIAFMELQHRSMGLAIREPKGTVYYIDLDNGDDAKDGLTTGNAWKTINKFTQGARAAGDIAKVRANTSEVIGADITFTSDGNSDEYITVKGCDSVDDPWGDGSDVKPIIDGNNAAVQVYGNSAHWWLFQNMDLTQSADALGAIRMRRCWAFDVDNCDIHDGGAIGIYVDVSQTKISDCDFYDNVTVHIATIYDYGVYVEGCTLNGGAGGTLTGMDVSCSGCVVIENSSFGQTTAHGTQDIVARDGSRVIMRRCKSNTLVVASGYDRGQRITSEDHNQVLGAQKTIQYYADKERDTAEVRTGGATDCIKITPKANINVHFPVNCLGQWRDTTWEEHDVPAAAQTRSIYVKGKGIVGVFPTAAQLFLVAEYFSGADHTVALATSTDVLSVDDTYTKFTVSFTPGQVNKVRYYLWLGYYEGAEVYYVDNGLYDN